jgi:hypothetical protein
MKETVVKTETAYSRWRKVNFGKILLSLDRYSTPVELNINGEKRISSYPGSLVSLLLLIILGLYGV